jgi:glyoxylase-like metal-dependent hydrolase (beta-lactamase superfamily II)
MSINTNAELGRVNPFLSQLREQSLHVGRYQIAPIPTGVFGLDGGAMFGTVPKVLWEKSNPPDSENRIAMEARALLLIDQQSERKILVDCGIGGDFVAKYGPKLGPKFATMYSVTGAGGAAAGISAIGLSPNDITDVILTHLHFDHAGGATCAAAPTETGSSALVPAFPKATYYVQRTNLETAKTPNIRERASYFSANFQPLLDAGCLTLLDGPVDELLPEISVFVSNGHTRGQQLVRVGQGHSGLVYAGDLIPTSSHVRLAWIMGYDLEPLVLIEEKRTLLAELARDGGSLFFEHDPYMDAATVAADGSDYRVSERLRLRPN